MSLSKYSRKAVTHQPLQSNESITSLYTKRDSFTPRKYKINLIPHSYLSLTPLYTINMNKAMIVDANINSGTNYLIDIVRM